MTASNATGCSALPEPKTFCSAKLITRMKNAGIRNKSARAGRIVAQELQLFDGDGQDLSAGGTHRFATRPQSRSSRPGQRQEDTVQIGFDQLDLADLESRLLGARGQSGNSARAFARGEVEPALALPDLFEAQLRS